MNPDVGQIAKEWYERNEPEGALSNAILRCFFIGTIIRRPGFLLMGETGIYNGKEIIAAPPGESNAWYIHFWASTNPMSSYDLCSEAPFAMEWVVFKRRNKIKGIRWAKLYAKDIGYHGRHYVST